MNLAKNSSRFYPIASFLRQYACIHNAVSGPRSTVGSELQSAVGKIFDPRLLEHQGGLVNSHMRARCSTGSEELLSRIVELNRKRSDLICRRDIARGERKALSAQIGALIKKHGVDSDLVGELKSKVEMASKSARDLDDARIEAEEELNELFSGLPNLLDDRVPLGADDASNEVISSWGDEFKEDSPGKMTYAHDEIAQRMGNTANEAAVLMAGTRFSILTGPLARLERSLVQYFLDFHSSNGYTEISVPFMVSSSTLTGTGQLPKFKDDLFHISNHKIGGMEDAYLIPTAEVPVLATYRQQIISKDLLPIQHVCYSPCFRAEVGSAGRDSRGLIRQHQFHKVELIKICDPSSSDLEHLGMVEHVESLLKSLRLPYRRVILSSGDTGFSARLCYDIEVWFPSQNSYREISSISNCHEFQSKRLGIRYRAGADIKGDKVYPHTLNGSGVAIGRALAAILENFQYQQEGSSSNGYIKIPEPLWEYMGVEVLLFKLSI